MKKELQIWLLGYDKNGEAVDYERFILGRKYTSKKNKKEMLKVVNSFYEQYSEVNQLLNKMPENCAYLECRIEDVKITNRMSECIDVIDSKILF